MNLIAFDGDGKKEYGVGWYLIVWGSVPSFQTSDNTDNSVVWSEFAF